MIHRTGPVSILNWTVLLCLCVLGFNKSIKVAIEISLCGKNLVEDHRLIIKLSNKQNNLNLGNNELYEHMFMDIGHGHQADGTLVIIELCFCKAQS